MTIVGEQSAKTELRAAAMATRNALTTEEAQAHSAVITETVCALPTFTAATTICSYLAIGNEVCTAEIITRALAAGKRVALPRTQFPSRQVMLHEVTGLHGLIPGRYGILEPASDAPQISPEEVGLFLIPGVAFDAAGNRLGYGAGCYDSLLAHSRGQRVALAYSCQLASFIPTEAHDIPMDSIITERGVIDCRRARRPADHLRLRNMQCYGHHGAFEAERVQGLRLAFDIDLRLDLQVPGMTDALATAVDYPQVYALVQRIQSEEQYCLLEALAERSAAAILVEFPAVAEVTVAVRKFNPPVGGLLDAFEVEITRTRAGE